MILQRVRFFAKSISEKKNQFFPRRLWRKENNRRVVLAHTRKIQQRVFYNNFLWQKCSNKIYYTFRSLLARARAQTRRTLFRYSIHVSYVYLSRILVSC